MRSWQRVVVTTAAAVLVAGCGGRGGEGDGGGSSREARRRAERASESPGQRLYRQSCIMCHGEGGRGTQLGPAVAGAAGGPQVAAVVRDGVAAPDSFPVPMPARGDGTFTNAQIDTVSRYVGSLAR